MWPIDSAPGRLHIIIANDMVGILNKTVPYREILSNAFRYDNSWHGEWFCVTRAFRNKKYICCWWREGINLDIGIEISVCANHPLLFKYTLWAKFHINLHCMLHKIWFLHISKFSEIYLFCENQSYWGLWRWWLYPCVYFSTHKCSLYM